MIVEHPLNNFVLTPQLPDAAADKEEVRRAASDHVALYHAITHTSASQHRMRRGMCTGLCALHTHTHTPGPDTLHPCQHSMVRVVWEGAKLFDIVEMLNVGMPAQMSHVAYFANSQSHQGAG